MFSFFTLSTLFFVCFFGAFVLSPSFSTRWRLICDSRRIPRHFSLLLPMKLENFFHIWNCCVETASISDKCMSLNINEPYQTKPHETKRIEPCCCHRWCCCCCCCACCSIWWRQRHFALLHVAVVTKGNFPNRRPTVGLKIDIGTAWEIGEKLISVYFFFIANRKANKLNLRCFHMRHEAAGSDAWQVLRGSFKATSGLPSSSPWLQLKCVWVHLTVPQLLQPLTGSSSYCVLRVRLAAINRPLPCWTAGQLELRALSALISALESCWSTLIKPFLHSLITPARAAGDRNFALNTFN